jgi:hypothetical protein
MKPNQMLIAVTVAVGLVNAGVSKTEAFTVTQTSSIPALQTALFGDQSDLQITSFQLGALPKAYGIFSNGNFLGIPQGMVMSTGEVKPLSGVNCADGQLQANGTYLSRQDPSCQGRLQVLEGTNQFVTDLNFDFVDPMTGDNIKDNVVLNIFFDAPETAKSLQFKYVFASEEYPEPDNPPPYNFANDDFFRVTLNQSSQQVSVLTASFIPNTLSSQNPAINWTPLDGYTAGIEFSAPLKAGNNQLQLQLADVGDDGYDSTVFLQQILVKNHPANPEPVPAVPAPPALIGFLTMGVLRALKMLRQR